MTNASGGSRRPDLQNLKAEFDERSAAGIPDDLGLRIRRATSWLERAEREYGPDANAHTVPDAGSGDPDAAFIFLWISFNSLYARATRPNDAYGPDDSVSETERFQAYFRTIAELDTERVIAREMRDQFSGPIRLLLDNPYIYWPFWEARNRGAPADVWEQAFHNANRRTMSFVMEGDVASGLSIVFSRLYVLRNQLIHGGATWRGSINRDQVRDGARIMAFLAPWFIALMLRHPDIDWGTPPYPPTDD